jgi:hypothetical protein
MLCFHFDVCSSEFNLNAFYNGNTQWSEERSKASSCQKIEQKRWGMALFLRIFIVLSLPTNFSQTVSFLVTTQAT